MTEALIVIDLQNDFCPGGALPVDDGDAIVLAQRTASRPSRDALEQTAIAIEEKWGLPAPKWLKVFKPLTK